MHDRNDDPGLPIAVSVTPARLDSDSRTLKEAVSLARLGFRSVVVEGAPSQTAFSGLPIEVRTAPAPAPPGQSLPSRVAWFALGPLMRLARPLTYLLQVNRGTYRAIPRAQLYWLHGPGLFPAVALRARAGGAPVVYDAHDFYPDAARGPERLPRQTRRSLWVDRRVEEICVRAAAARVTVGEGVAELQRSHFRTDFTVLHNAHDPRLDSPVQRDLRQTLGLDDEAFVIAVVGNGKPGTAIEPALEAMSRLPPRVHMAFLGRGHEQLARSAERHGLATRVHVVEPVAPGEVTAFTATADAAAKLNFIPSTPNLPKALPNRLYQAVAAGLPLLYPAQMSAIRNLAEQRGLGVPIDPRAASSIAAAIESLLDDPARLAGIREQVRGIGGGAQLGARGGADG